MTEGSKKLFHRQMEVLLQRHKAVFEEGYGAIRGFKAIVHLKQTGGPIFKKARPARTQESNISETGQIRSSQHCD